MSTFCISQSSTGFFLNLGAVPTRHRGGLTMELDTSIEPGGRRSSFLDWDSPDGSRLSRLTGMTFPSCPLGDSVAKSFCRTVIPAGRNRSLVSFQQSRFVPSKRGFLSCSEDFRALSSFTKVGAEIINSCSILRYTKRVNFWQCRFPAVDQDVFFPTCFQAVLPDLQGTCWATMTP
ncbi:uncharacterized protein BKA78DRAFT_143707 [Phyllosticta capitalensis]|uniref:uncharacterized protein n=1 Tax=Phyllosticta capitalensis TaxID=121624 RepID=UPI00312FE72F